MGLLLRLLHGFWICFCLVCLVFALGVVEFGVCGLGFDVGGLLV